MADVSGALSDVIYFRSCVGFTHDIRHLCNGRNTRFNFSSMKM